MVQSLHFERWIATITSSQSSENHIIIINRDSLFCLFPFRKCIRRVLIKFKIIKRSRKQFLFSQGRACTQSHITIVDLVDLTCGRLEDLFEWVFEIVRVIVVTCMAVRIHVYGSCYKRGRERERWSYPTIGRLQKLSGRHRCKMGGKISRLDC